MNHTIKIPVSSQSMIWHNVVTLNLANHYLSNYVIKFGSVLINCNFNFTFSFSSGWTRLKYERYRHFVISSCLKMGKLNLISGFINCFYLESNISHYKSGMTYLFNK